MESKRSMKVFIERHTQGYCLVNAETYLSLADGEPHNRGTMYFNSKKLAVKYAEDNDMEVV